MNLLKSDMDTLASVLQEEIERCQELLIQYKEIGPAGAIAYKLLKQDINTALSAAIEGDVVQMIKSYKALKSCN